MFATLIRPSRLRQIPKMVTLKKLSLQAGVDRSRDQGFILSDLVSPKPQSKPSLHLLSSAPLAPTRVQHAPYWQHIRMWEDVPEADFLSYAWQGSSYECPELATRELTLHFRPRTRYSGKIGFSAFSNKSFPIASPDPKTTVHYMTASRLDKTSWRMLKAASKRRQWQFD